MFSCVWLHFKKCFENYFLVFGCVLENTIENTFSTCCSRFLTFSRLPNEYIISFIPQYKNTNKTQKKKIIKSGQIERRRNRERWLGSTRGCNRRGASCNRDRCEGEIAISAVLRAISMISADNLGGRSQRSWRTILTIEALDDLDELSFPCGAIGHKQRLSTLSSFCLSLSLLRVTRKWFEGKMKV